MDAHILYLYAQMEEEEQERHKYTYLRRYRRSIRDKCNPLELPPSLKYFRLSKEAFRYILDEVDGELKEGNALSPPPVLKISACLRFLAEGGYQRGVGKEIDVGLARTTFCKVLKEVLDVLERKLCSKWISISMTEEQKQQSKQRFFERSGFPRVIGCVDGTHVKIIAPRENKHLFYNRKGYYSINAMIICDHEMRIIGVDAIHPGSCHDAAIWRTSDAKAYLNSQYVHGDRNSLILGDAGYGLEPYLMTPYREPCTASETRFNKIHAKARNIVERTIGILKNRFRCLIQARELHYRPEKAAQIINVCSALHNICIYYRIGNDEFVSEILQYDTELQFEITTEGENSEEAQRIRNSIKNSFYN